MKNNFNRAITAIILGFLASCSSEPQGPSQAELDAQVEAKVKAATEQLKAECDSRIMAAAQMRKDSILVKQGMQKPAPAAKEPVKQAPPKQTTAPAPAPAPAPTPAPAPAAIKEKPKGLQSLSDQNKENQPAGSKGLKGLSDQEKAKSPEPSKRGGLKGLSDQNK